MQGKILLILLFTVKTIESLKKMKYQYALWISAKTENPFGIKDLFISRHTVALNDCKAFVNQEPIRKSLLLTEFSNSNLAVVKIKMLYECCL